MDETTAAQKPADALGVSWVDHVPLSIQPYLRLMRLDRPIGSWLLFWPGTFGLILGAIASERGFSSGHDLYLLALFGVGAVVLRGAGCTYNDIIDKDIDARVARTQSRPIASGAVSVRQAVAFLVLQLLVGLVILIQLNGFAQVLGAASLLLVGAYPFMKRITWWPQAWLGLTFNWGALLGFSAQTASLDWAAVLLYAGLVFWTIGYDTIYAQQDKDDDALIGVRSTALLFGSNAKNWITGFYTTALALILSAGFADHAGWPFAFVMLLAGLHLLWQAHRFDSDDRALSLELFRSNRDTGALMALAWLLASWIW